MKDCLIIGPAYALHFEEPYNLFKEGVLKGGVYMVGWELENKRCWCDWYTTLNPNRPEKKKLILTKTYNPDAYPRIDNAPDIIESKSKDIPVDYDGLIAVPITFFKYYDYLPYDILELRTDLKLNNKQLFARLIIRRKQL